MYASLIPHLLGYCNVISQIKRTVFFKGLSNFEATFNYTSRHCVWGVCTYCYSLCINQSYVKPLHWHNPAYWAVQAGEA